MPEVARPFRWREPTSLLPLRWGGYRTRLLGGLFLVVAGSVATAGGGGITPFAGALLYLGSVAQGVGWAVLPAAGWRRVWALLLAAPAPWLLLVGPAWLWVLLLPYLGWLLVRHRPVASYPTVTFVLAGAIFTARILPPSYSSMLPALGLMAALMLLSALAARAVHVAQARVRRGRKPSLSQVPPL